MTERLSLTRLVSDVISRESESVSQRVLSARPVLNCELKSREDFKPASDNAGKVEEFHYPTER